MQNRDGSFITCASDGRLKLEKEEFEQNEKNNLLLKMAKFVIIDANSPTSKRQICIYDDIALKTPYGFTIFSIRIIKFYSGNFLICELNNTVTGNGPNCSEYSTWRLHKSNSPYMPEWVFLRPYINNNYLLPRFEGFQNISNNFSNGSFN